MPKANLKGLVKGVLCQSQTNSVKYIFFKTVCNRGISELSGTVLHIQLNTECQKISYTSNTEEHFSK